MCCRNDTGSDADSGDPQVIGSQSLLKFKRSAKTLSSTERRVAFLASCVNFLPSEPH